MMPYWAFLMTNLLLRLKLPSWVMWMMDRYPGQARTLSESIDSGIFIASHSIWMHLRPWSLTLEETDIRVGFSRRYTAIPFALTANLLAQLWSILQSQGAKRGSVDDQLTSRCHSHNKNSFWLESNIYSVQSHQGWSKHSKSHYWWKIDGTKNLR